MLYIDFLQVYGTRESNKNALDQILIILDEHGVARDEMSSIKFIRLIHALELLEPKKLYFSGIPMEFK